MGIRVFATSPTVEVRKQFGGVLVFTAVLIPVLLTLAAFAYLWRVVHLSRSEIQFAADAAALAAARSLCSTKPCYDQARTTAINVLGQQEVVGAFGKSWKLDLTGPPTTPEGTWSVPGRGLEIEIQRGRWRWSDINGEWEFESTEGNNWLNDRPGMPRHALANAVRILIRRSGLNSLFDLFYSAEVFGESIAITAPMEPVPVAPFALPVCALTDVYGDVIFDQSQMINSFDHICRGDRLFVESGHFCPNQTDKRCSVQPAFWYTPCDGSQTVCSPFPSVVGVDNSPRGYSEISRYISPRGLGFGNTVDKYGVVGLPFAGGNVDELEVVKVLEALDSNGQLPEAKIGQQFVMVHGGLQGTLPNERTQLALTGAIGNQNLVDASHVPMSSTTLGTVEVGRIVSFGTNRNFKEMFHGMRVNAPLFPDHFDLPKDYLHTGFCEGWRTRLGCYDLQLNGNTIQSPNLGGAFADLDNDPSCAYDDTVQPTRNPNMMCLKPDPNNGFALNCTAIEFANLMGVVVNNLGLGYGDNLSANTPVWTVKIPVIADADNSATPCQGIDGQQVEAMVDANHNYEIVGFVEMIIYDYDVGPLSANQADQQAPFPQKLWTPDGNQMIEDLWHAPHLNFYGPLTPYVPNGLPDTLNGNPSATGPNPWHFYRGTPQPPSACNLVRARVSCNTDFIPSSNNSSVEGERVPQLVG